MLRYDQSKIPVQILLRILLQPLTGDLSYTTADRWIATDDIDGSNDPSLNHNYWGPGAGLTPSLVGLTVYGCASTDGTFAEFELTVPANSSVVLMFFAGQSPDQAASQAKAMNLDLLPAETLFGLTGVELSPANWSPANDVCANDTEDPAFGTTGVLDCGETFQAVANTDYIVTVDPATSASSTTRQDCWSGLRLRTPQFLDNCGIASIAVTFSGAAGTTPSQLPADFTLSAANGDFAAGETDFNIVLPAPSLQFYGSATTGSATTEMTYVVFDEAGNSETCSVFIEVSDETAPVVTCTEFTATFEGCPDGLGPNTPTGNWFPLPASGMFNSAVGGSFITTVDVSGCVSDNCSDLEYSLGRSFEENRMDGSVDLINVWIFRDAALNEATDSVFVRSTIQDNEAPVFDLGCQIDVVETTELDGIDCPNEATVSLTIGQTLTVNDGYTAGGVATPPLAGCVSDNCTADDDLVITVADIVTVDALDGSRTISVTFWLKMHQVIHLMILSVIMSLSTILTRSSNVKPTSSSSCPKQSRLVATKCPRQRSTRWR